MTSDSRARLQVQWNAFWQVFKLPTIAIMAIVAMTTSAFAATALTSVAQPTIDATAWKTYTDKFLTREGRIVDDANGNISHSEGQGYGLLLAYLAGNAADFEQIWTFTQTEMLIRNDGLSAWKWDPNARPHITDTNNASDGDMLIAYALALAAKKWNRPDYRDNAKTIVSTLLKKQIITHDSKSILLPAIRGFTKEDRPTDGPVINLSYWIYEALPLFNELVPSQEWANLASSGLQLSQASRFGTRKLPSDWISLHGAPHPAKGFPPEFGYNDLRIVLYLTRAGLAKEPVTALLANAMTDQNGNVILVDVITGDITDTLSDPGYTIIPRLAACAKDGTPLPAAMKRFVPTQYFPSTLHLLALSYAAQYHPECL